MKAIKSFLICAVAVTPLVIQPTAQAQSKPEFCQIHSGNVSQYVSEYNPFNHSTPTIYRPFIQNRQPYQITQELAAKPLFYVAISDGSIGAAFELKGRYGNLLIGNNDVVVQHLKFYPVNSYIEIAGLCVNGTFIASPKKQALPTINLPLQTQSALQEARFGISQEQIGNMFK